MSPFVWMFISSYADLRAYFIDSSTLTSLVQLEYSGFDGATVPICTFTLNKQHMSQFVGSFVRLSSFKGSDQQGPKTLEAIKNNSCGWFHLAKPDDFKKISGSPFAYWASDSIFRAFDSGKTVGRLGKLGKGSDTGKNELFIRAWNEVDFAKVEFEMQNDKPYLVEKKFYPTHKAGGYRKWFGFGDWVVDWGSDGAAIKAYGRGNIRNRQYYFQQCISWGKITSADFSIRFVPKGSIADDAGPSAFLLGYEYQALGFLNSKVAGVLLKFLSPTLNFQVGDISRLPVVEADAASMIAEKCVRIAEVDWDSYERSWKFQFFPIVAMASESCTLLASSYNSWVIKNRITIVEMKRLEEENNRLFIDAYGLQDELTPDVPIEQITLTVNPAYRYGSHLTEEEQWLRFRQDTMEELISYVIGCMMGRYSLDEPGLIYAHAGNVDFDATRYKTFPADADGIVPITDEFWFEDAAAHRVREFLRAVWGADTLDENMAWLAESLGIKASETPDETIRRYLADKFFKDHLQTYKKRPIYWLFSSGKQGAFQALVYLHRYHEGTLARLRAEYVVPLTGKLQARIEMLEKDAATASSTAARNKLGKQIEKLRKKHVELLAYDEKLRHHADMRISLDLDDGVKVNYGKFGDLLAEVKAVTGGAGDE